MTPDKVGAALASLGIDAALVDEGLSYFHGSGDDGDKLYVSEIRKALSVLTEALDERAVTEEMVLDAKLLMEVSEIRAGRDDADSTDVTVSKRARRHWEQVQDAYNAAMKEAP